MSELIGYLSEVEQLNGTLSDPGQLVGNLSLPVAIGGGLTEEVKQALLDLFQHLAYTDADGQDYYDALYNAFYPPAELVRITAVYTQTSTVYPDTPLDDLKDDLVVTAHYSDGTSEEVTTYTLSGTLTAGASVVTVTYEDKTTTFSVTVSAPAVLSSITAVYTQSGVVYPTDSLDSLKPDLVVTAHYSDSSTATVTTYTLSGTLTVGTSTITVTYSDKTTTFNVTVTAVPVLDSITATYTQSGTVYDTDSLDSLKADLVVTATYSDSSTETVPSADYTLSGTLTVGTSTITVTYEGKTTTFSVTVTHATSTYVTDGLIFRLDGIDNTENGHDASATTWEDLVGTYDIDTITNGTWSTDGLSFGGNNTQIARSQDTYTAPNSATIEMVVNIAGTGTQIIASFGTQNSNVSQRFVAYSDNTVGFVGTAGKSYNNSEAALSDVHTMAAIYSSGYTVEKAFVNNTQVSLSSKSHSFKRNSVSTFMVLGNADPADATKYPLNGKILAVRIYNRALTDAELTQNHAIDIERFGLGAV